MPVFSGGNKVNNFTLAFSAQPPKKVDAQKRQKGMEDRRMYGSNGSMIESKKNGPKKEPFFSAKKEINNPGFGSVSVDHLCCSGQSGFAESGSIHFYWR